VLPVPVIYLYLVRTLYAAIGGSLLFDLAPYLPELLSVSVVAAFMAVSPGADFAMVTRNSLLHSRSAGVYSSLGIGLAIWLHVAYSIAGLAMIISKSILLFSVLKYLGAAYLIYVGWKTFRAEPQRQGMEGWQESSLSNFGALRIGFVTNALNPKTSIFFLSIFTQVVSPQTPFAVQVVYGAIISAAHMLWFGFVAVVLTQPAFLQRFNRWRRSIEKAVGVVLMGFGLKVAATSSS